MDQLEDLSAERLNTLLNKRFSLFITVGGTDGRLAFEVEDEDGRKHLTGPGIVLLRFLERWTDLSVEWDQIQKKGVPDDGE